MREEKGKGGRDHFMPCQARHRQHKAHMPCMPSAKARCSKVKGREGQGWGGWWGCIGGEVKRGEGQAGKKR